MDSPLSENQWDLLPFQENHDNIYKRQKVPLVSYVGGIGIYKRNTLIKQ